MSYLVFVCYESLGAIFTTQTRADHEYKLFQQVSGQQFYKVLLYKNPKKTQKLYVYKKYLIEITSATDIRRTLTCICLIRNSRQGNLQCLLQVTFYDTL